MVWLKSRIDVERVQTWFCFILLAAFSKLICIYQTDDIDNGSSVFVRLHHLFDDFQNSH
jgi:hypothetical protein